MDREPMLLIKTDPFPVLETETLTLRKIQFADMDEFFVLKSDERLLVQYNGARKTYEEARLKLESINEGMKKNQSLLWGITKKHEKRVIGSVCFWNVSKEKETAEIGYELMVEWQGKGIMQEVLPAIIQYGFKSLGLQGIEATPQKNNPKSRRLLERFGFVRVPKKEQRDTPYTFYFLGKEKA